MSSAPHDPLAIVRSIAADPAALAELRRVVVSDELRDLTREVRALAEAQTRTERALEQLIQTVDKLAARIDTLANRFDHDRGALIELKYERHGHAYFAPIARRLRLVAPDQLDAMLDPAVASGTLKEEEAHQIRLADLIFRGRHRTDDLDVFLVVEASGVVNDDDIGRAAWRAELLGRVGVVALAVVAGDVIGFQARDLARTRGVWAVHDGIAEPPDAA